MRCTAAHLQSRYMLSCKVSMEIYTGAAVSIIAESLYCKLWPRRGLKTTTVKTTDVLSGNLLRCWAPQTCRWPMKGRQKLYPWLWLRVGSHPIGEELVAQNKIKLEPN